MKLISIFLLSILLSISACSDQQTAEEYIEQGKKFSSQKEWKSAIIEFKNAVKQEPENAQARALLGKTYLETYSLQAAIKELGRARDLGYDAEEILLPLGKTYTLSREYQKIIDEITVQSDYPDALKADILALRAIAFMGLNNKDAALRALNEAKNRDESSADVRLAWARFEKLNGDTEAQIAWLTPLLERDGGNAEAWSLMGEIETERLNLEAAEKAYSRAIELRQYSHFDMARRAMVRVTQKKMEAARSDINTLKKAGANWPLVNHIDGLLLLQDKKTDEAKSVFQALLAKVPNYPPSQYSLALIYFNESNFESAASLLEQYIASNPDQARAKILFASTLVRLNQLEDALKLLNDLRMQNPEDSSVLSLLGNVYLRQGQTEKAIQILKKAVTLNPEQAGSRLQLGATLLGKESTLDEGQQELIKAIELNPDLLEAEVALFRSYLAEKKYDEARKIAERLDKKNNESSQGANLYALTLLAEDKKQETISYLSKTLERFPADFLTSHNLARIYLRENNLDKAKPLYEKVLKNESSNLQALNQLALISARQGDQEQMMLRLKQAQERNPDEISPRIALALQYIRQGKANEAIQLLNGAKEQQTQLPAYILLMAQAKLAVNENQHAIRSLKALISKKPDISVAHFLLAQAYAKEENTRQLRESLENTIALSPDHLSANVTLARLDLIEGQFDRFKERVAFLGKRYPDNVDVKFLVAKSASGDRDFDSAIDTLTTLMEQTPHSNVIIDLSRNQWASGDKKAAISGLELWVQGNPEDVRALMLLAQFYLVEKQFEEARIIYEQLVAQKHETLEILNNLAFLLKDSDPQKGIQYAERALELKPGDALAQDTLAMLYLEVGENAKALELSKKAVNNQPDIPDIQYNYATVLVANNRKEEARKALNDFYNRTESEAIRQRIKDELDKL